MKNTTTIAVVAIAIILVVGFIAYTSSPTIAARGISNIDVVPDEVSVNINIETHNSTAQLAQEQNKIISDLLLTELIKAGFSRDELKFASYNVYQDYDYSYGRSTPKGYVVYQQLVVKTNNTDKVPAIVDAAVSSGALISYIDFQISDNKQSDIKAQALEQASKDAETKASAIARGQHKSLWRLVSIQNDEMPIFQPYRYFDSGIMAGAAVDKATLETNAVLAQKAATSLSPTDQTISASVTAQYKLSWF